MPKLELNPQNEKEAIASIQQYWEENLAETIGEMKAGLLLRFFLQEIGPLLYNQGVRDASTRLTQRMEDLEGELHEHPFTYWAKSTRSRRS